MIDFMDDDCDIEGFPLETYKKFAKLREGVTVEEFIEALFDDVFCAEDEDIRLYEIAKNKVEFECDRPGSNVVVIFRFNDRVYTTFIYTQENFNRIFEVF